MIVVRGFEKPNLSATMVLTQTLAPTVQTKKIQNYLIYLNEVLGRGNFSQVFRGINTLNNETVAVKVVDLNSMKTAALRNLLQSEIDVLKIVKHPNILRCLDIFSSSNNCYIITELCNEGDLESRVIKARGTLEEPQCRSLICDIYQGLLYLADQRIIHRDIKVANIFLKDGVAKIADFGFAKRTSDHFKDINVGSPIYMSPQGLLESVYGPKTDVWAFGVLLYEMLHGDPPLSFCQVESELKLHIARPISSRAFKMSIPQDLRDLIVKCLEVDEHRRISVRDIQFHPYIVRAMRELGRTFQNPSQQRETQFLSAMTASKPDINRSNSASQLQIRNRMARTMTSADKYNEITPKKSTGNMTVTMISSPVQNRSPVVIVQNPNQLSTHKIRLQLGTAGGSTATTTTTSSQMAPMTFDQSLYLLHYCRLIYKTINLMNKTNRVAMLKVNDCYANWLLDTLDDVQQHTTLLEGSDRQRKLKGVLIEYQHRYNRELKRNQQLSVKHETIVSVTKQLLEYLDKKIMGEPDIDQLDLVYLGHSLCVILETTEVLRLCRERGDYSMITGCKAGLDACLSAETQSFSVSTYLVARGKSTSAIGYCM